MKITKIKVAKVLSFGPEQELDGFNIFNLFIGKNGSGKSNVLKILKGLSVNYSMSNGEIQIAIPTHREGTTIRSQNFFTPNLFANGYTNREAGMSDIKGLLEISYEIVTNINQTLPEKKTVKFQDNVDGFLLYEKGNINELAQMVSNIELPKTEFEFFKDLSLYIGEYAKHKLPLLNFGLYYIFGLHYRFNETGTFIQSKTRESENVEDNTENLPSGVLNCSKILTRYFMAKGDIILIDEPELHLEPRTIRRLFHFLVWLIIRSKEDRTESENEIFQLVEDVLLKKSYNDKNGKLRSKWAIYQNEVDGEINYLDIQIEKQPYDRQKQLFIASHSSVLINEFLNISESASIYEFDSVVMEYKQIRLKNNGTGPFDEESIDAKGLFSKVTKVVSNTHLLLDSLGCKGSDLLQANGVIWVEGPSDVVYIQKWLEMYSQENYLKKFTQGKDYEFQMFGGTLLDSLCFIKMGNDQNEEYKKLVSIFSFSKNAFVVIDSDAVKTAKKGIIDKSTFVSAKKFIKEQFELLSANNRNLGLWYNEGNTDIRTIESYLDDESDKLIKSKSWTKKIAAQKVTEGWGKNKKLSGFKNGLGLEIKSLYEKIQKWNE
jgi:hypothetical protein